MRDLFFQIALFVCGVFISLTAPFRPTAQQKKVAIAFGVLIMGIAPVWAGYGSGVRESEVSVVVEMPTTAVTNTPTRLPTATVTNTPTRPPTRLPNTPTNTPIQPTRTPEFKLGDSRVGVDGATQMYVPAGSFEMGSNNGDSREQPVHTVAMSPYWIGMTEVTNAEYGECVATSRSGCVVSESANDTRFNGANQPVVSIDWNSADSYCRWAGGALPTEAQWEYVARGPSGWEYPWGNEFDGAKVNYCDSNCEFGDTKDTAVNDHYQYTSPVGSYPDGASWVGAMDMAGNVLEWTNDWHDSEYYGKSSSENPAGSTSGIHKILRGGGWGHVAYYMRGSSRGFISPLSNRVVYIGFRCVFSPGN